MKRFLTIILSVLLISAVVFCVYSCQNKEKTPPENNPSNAVTPSPDIVQPTPDVKPDGDDAPEKENNPEKTPSPTSAQTEDTKKENNVTNNSPVYTGVGIYHGRTDSARIEITLDTEFHPLLLSCELTPELAENFSSLGLEENTIISFEYHKINDQYVISKIIK